ncbi:MAG: hypothetical protein ACLGSA_08345 [Acidobacteriota bacterium]
MSLYGSKTAQTAVQPWIADVPVGKGIFDFYDSLGDVVISTSTNIPSVLDGPMVVRKYRDLTINAAAADVILTTTNRCRGLMLLVEGNLVMQRTASYVPSISMTARGARGHAGMNQYDFSIPAGIQLSGKGWSKADALKLIRENGYALCDRWLWDDWGKITGVSAPAWTPGTVLLAANGCGHAYGAMGNQGGSGTATAGYGGASGLNGGTGGGGGGGYYYAFGGGGFQPFSSGSGRSWGGGAGGGSQVNDNAANNPPVDDWGGRGGYGQAAGAGNPAGDNSTSGTGGILVVICKGNITIASGGVIEADGVMAPNASYPGGSSGGGHVSIISPAAPANNGTIRANGGAARSGSPSGGAGGAGSVVTKTFSQMGW